MIDRVANWFNGLKNRGKFPDENPKFIVQQWRRFSGKLEKVEQWLWFLVLRSSSTLPSPSPLTEWRKRLGTVLCTCLAFNWYDQVWHFCFSYTVSTVIQRKRWTNVSKSISISWVFDVVVIPQILLFRSQFMNEKSGGLLCFLYSIILSKGFSR